MEQGMEDTVELLVDLGFQTVWSTNIRAEDGTFWRLLMDRIAIHQKCLDSTQQAGLLVYLETEPATWD